MTLKGTMNRPTLRLFFSFAVLLASCTPPPRQPASQSRSAESLESPRDPHSYSNPNQVRVRHLDLDLEVSFQNKTLQGTAALTLERAPGRANAPLVLDTHDLTVTQIEAVDSANVFHPVKFTLGQKDKILGSPLSIDVPPASRQVRVHYSSSPAASALQWLNPEQTAGKKHPFLFSQSEAIYARTWIPLQDSPSVRITYTARIRTPRHLKAVMSAEGNFQLALPETKAPGTSAGGTSGVPVSGGNLTQFSFQMNQAIPSYLIALAAGNMEFKSLGPRTGVYAEPSVLEKAAAEFTDTEKMIEATERVYGPYRWGRYDLLVLPPSFPYGGMENPRLTFATPTILAGDKSLVSLVAHELAHSWSGNLVTNATWSDFWLNEGFTTYVENRIIEAVYGPERARMEAALNRQELEESIKTKEEKDQVLHIDLTGRDPEEGVTDIPYIKGALFLRHLEQAYGRPRFDSFVRSYFDHFAFQSIPTRQFEEYLRENLLASGAANGPGSAGAHPVPVEEWIYKSGIPSSAPRLQSDALSRVQEQAANWIAGRASASQLRTSAWSYHEWLYFLRALPTPLSTERMQQLDAAFHFTRSGNSEILNQWLLMTIRSDYNPAYAHLEQFLTSVGRRKFLRPLYTELAKTEAGRQRAFAIYKKARPSYHPIAVATCDEILKWREEGSSVK